MPTKYPLKQLQMSALERPEGSEARLLARGRIEGDFLVVEDVEQPNTKSKFSRNRTWRYSVSALSDKSRLPEGYADFILARGRREGSMVYLDHPAIHELQEKFPKRFPKTKPQPPVPTLTELANNFTTAMSGWAGAGFKIVAQSEYEQRHASCLACEHWRPDAYLGLGKCRKCGCTKVKLWLATSRCPDHPPRW